MPAVIRNSRKFGADKAHIVSVIGPSIRHIFHVRNRADPGEFGTDWGKVSAEIFAVRTFSYSCNRQYSSTRLVCYKTIIIIIIIIIINRAVHTDREVTANRPDIIIKNKKEKTCTLIDVAIPADRNAVQRKRKRS